MNSLYFSPPTLAQAVEWRTPIWLPAVKSLLDRAADRLRPGAEVLELGYGSGLLACYLAAVYGVRVTGYEADPAARDAARANAARFGLQDRVSFEAVEPGRKLDIGSLFDIVFLKSFLYHVQTVQAYQDWLDCLVSALRPGGLLLAAENGRGGRLDRFYRKRIRRSRWSEFMLFDQARLQDFKQCFSRVDVQCFGRYSQFFSFFPRLCSGLQALEQRICPPTADQCFVAAILAQKAGQRAERGQRSEIRGQEEGAERGQRSEIRGQEEGAERGQRSEVRKKQREERGSLISFRLRYKLRRDKMPRQE